MCDHPKELIASYDNWWIDFENEVGIIRYVDVWYCHECKKFEIRDDREKVKLDKLFRIYPEARKLYEMMKEDEDFRERFEIIRKRECIFIRSLIGRVKKILEGLYGNRRD